MIIAIIVTTIFLIHNATAAPDEAENTALHDQPCSPTMHSRANPNDRNHLGQQHLAGTSKPAYSFQHVWPGGRQSPSQQEPFPEQQCGAANYIYPFLTYKADTSPEPTFGAEGLAFPIQKVDEILLRIISIYSSLKRPPIFESLPRCWTRAAPLRSFELCCCLSTKRAWCFSFQ